MNAHRPALDTPAALITKAADVLGRVMRVAAQVRPTLCLRLQGELALTDRVLEEVERLAAHDARYAALAAMNPKRDIPPKCPEFVGGRRALPAPRRKRHTAGRAA